MNGFCGIVHSNSNNGLDHVPLEESVISVAIVDVSARVSVTQVYKNELDVPTPRSKYVFPVPARAAVCAFAMIRQDRRLIYGVAKEKSQATEEYEAGVQEGKLSGLVEWVSDDVFTISLGSIPARQTVTTRVMFVMDLMNDDLTDKVRLQLPLSLGERYGPIPAGLVNAKRTKERTRLKITVEVQSSGPILSITCPSHDSIVVNSHKTHSGRLSNRRMIAKFRSKTFLDRDFVLVIRADGLDAPRCFVEHDPRGGTIALQLTLLPKFKLSPIPQQEYIFLVDRSSSMNRDNRINVAKESLAMLLPCLPNQSTRINMFSFGHSCSSLWHESVTYDEYNLQQAVHYINGMDADMGPGTELRLALESIFASRQRSIPAAIFVLTDGEIFEEDPTKQVVIDAMAASLPNASFRLFVLGIGLQTSISVCEGLARVGNGECLMAITSESILGKCTSLLRAGRTSTITDVSIDWGVALDRDLGTQVNGPGPIQQSPAVITHLYPHSRSVVFAILDTDKSPRSVTVRGKTDGDNTVELRVMVESIKFGRDSSSPPFVHVLAARRLIRDIEEDRFQENFPESVRKAAIVRLGERYQLASSHTSFVAVDYGKVEYSEPGKRRRSTSGLDNLSLNPIQWFRTIWTYFSTPFLSSGPSSSRRTEQRENVPGGWQSNIESSSQSLEMNDDFDYESSYGSSDTYSTMSSLESHSSSEREERRRRRRARSRQRRRQMRTERSRSPQVHPAPGLADRQNTQQAPNLAPSTPPAPISSDVTRLVQLMSYDGSFDLNNALVDIVGLQTINEARTLHKNESLCAVALAIAFLEKSLTDQRELLQALVDKGMEYARRHTGYSEFGRVLMRARQLVR